MLRDVLECFCEQAHLIARETRVTGVCVFKRYECLSEESRLTLTDVDDLLKRISKPLDSYFTKRNLSKTSYFTKRNL